MKRRSKKQKNDPLAGFNLGSEPTYNVVYRADSGDFKDPVINASSAINYMKRAYGTDDDSQSHEVDVVVLQTDKVAVAHVTVQRTGECDRRTIHGLGDSKRHPDDAHDPAFGYDLALARAFKDVAKKLGSARAAV